MIQFFRKDAETVYAVDADHRLSAAEQEKFSWLFSGAEPVDQSELAGRYVGPRREMITPWSTNAVEITQNMGLSGVRRIEEFRLDNSAEPAHDKMLQRVYEGLNGEIFTIDAAPAPIVYINDIHAYNLAEGLALSPEEEEYLTGLAEKLGRPLTDSEVFGFSQVNSEHCRHKIFNGTFIIDGEEMPSSLFKLIKKTSQEHPHKLVSAYKDNVAFVEGPTIDQFAPVNPERPDYF
ncbi:MAG: phosphoribosylformylglycinamidine synthase, partial [Muribaculaceae bacterium]|nr:phosphoribosylformylglycinamidine synthase [Muribaculaceae bacterium]